MYRLLVFITLLSCKEKTKDINPEPNRSITELQVKKNPTNSSYKELTTVLYQHLLEDEFLSTKEFTQVFGHLYDESERYLKKQSVNEANQSNLCYEITNDCESFIFSDMKRKSNEISFGYEMEEIQQVINRGKVEDGLLILTFPNNEKVTFYFEKNESVNSFNQVISNILTKNDSFLSPYEE